MIATSTLDQPGTYLHWSIFQVSVANLVLIAVMVVIFAVAIIVPLPTRPGDLERGGDVEPLEGGTAGYSRGALGDGASGNAAENRMWTARVRRFALRTLPPDKLLPDRQPAYVASWIYVFGVASVVTFGLACVSGFFIALGGANWWQVSSVGHFANSLHLWSVEAFMAFMVIHLWGKFWMAAWRGRRALTWITGVVAFLASIVECFTGYLSQQNFDSQWISTNGKDAVNSTGLGAFFNLMNSGQMLLWHVVLLPLALTAIIGAHVLLVRVRGVVRPLPERRVRGHRARAAARATDASAWKGPTRPYDILKEATVAGAVALVLVVVLAAVLSSPNEPPVTIQTWARVAPADLLITANSELAGTSETATYGPPYNNGTGNVQRIGISPQTWAGAGYPIDPAKDFVIGPLTALAPDNPRLRAALAAWSAATPKQQAAWTAAYDTAVKKVRFVNGQPVVPGGGLGPVPALMTSELALARSGGLDTDLVAGGGFYGSDQTKPLLFIEDGQYFANLATAQHLTGDQWGVMNETGSYPGQPWLWLYTLWYQLPGLNSSANIDLIAVGLTGIATLLLLAVPWLPGVRDLPEVIPLHRLVWRSWNRSGGGTGGVPERPVEPAPLAGAGRDGGRS